MRFTSPQGGPLLALVAQALPGPLGPEQPLQARRARLRAPPVRSEGWEASGVRQARLGPLDRPEHRVSAGCFGAFPESSGLTSCW